MSHVYPPLVVAGMHRSGTSMVASWLAAGGIDMGESLVPSDEANPLGYFEDTRFLELNRRILAHCVKGGRGGHPDWGWDEDESFDPRGAVDHRAEAESLLEERARQRHPWGWKEPRTTPLLEFWDSAAGGNASYLLLYRYPWDVADSMQRLGADVFLAHPGYAYRIWAFYNRHLLAFHERHRERALLVSANALARNPELLARLLRYKLGVPWRPSVPPTISASRFRTVAGADPLIGLLAETTPDCIGLLRRLDARADMASTDLWRAPAAHPLARRDDGPVDLSVVVPCFNQGELLIEAVASVERTAPPRTELVIVNDGSDEPRTLAVLGALRGLGFHVHDQEHVGLSAARNTGARLARGRFLLPLDDDNRLLPGFAADALRLLEEDPSADIVYGDRLEFGLRKGRVRVPDFDFARLLRGNFIDACAVFRRRVWESCGGYDTAMPGWEDWEFWLACASRGFGFRHLPGITFEYRVRPGSLVTVCNQPGIADRLRRHVFAKHLDLYAERWRALEIEVQQRAAEQEALAALVSERDTRLSALGAERDEIAARSADLHASREQLASQVGALHGRVEALELERLDRARNLEELGSQREAASRALEAAARERDELVARCDELTRADALWRERVAAMERTRAWRTRETAIRLKRLLGLQRDGL